MSTGTRLVVFAIGRDEPEEAGRGLTRIGMQWTSLTKQRHDMFMDGYKIISMKLKEMYRMITLGGDAELEQVDSLDPFEGIIFSVRPPKKSWKNISNLSGGEKTLSSLALVFALHHFKPTPLYVMDEIDAALDFRNVSIVGHYLKVRPRRTVYPPCLRKSGTPLTFAPSFQERTKDAQFIIISLRNNMFELADWLIGIYKTDNVTKSVMIDPNAFTIPQEEEGSENSPSSNSCSVSRSVTPKAFTPITQDSPASATSAPIM
mmetsp:Transcript_33483/g.94044  ORF Transcript_33483/g.94044 Transcript_33483/m.94044 type:complete len:261 (-) Transcript_33483:44-826(-)